MSQIDQVLDNLMCSIHISAEKRQAAVRLETARRNWLSRVVQVLTSLDLQLGRQRKWSTHDHAAIMQLINDMDNLEKLDTVQSDVQYLLKQEATSLRSQFDTILQSWEAPEVQRQQCQKILSCYLG
jgi:hypothetical protein